MSSSSHKPARSVVYLLNLFEPKLELPHEIIPGFILRKPSDGERDFISKTMHHSSVYSRPYGLYEMGISFQDRQMSMGRETNQTKWRYYVIEYPSEDNDVFKTKDIQRKYRMTNFQLAAIISDARLQWSYESNTGPEIFFRGGSLTMIHNYAAYLETMLMREKAIPVLTTTQIKDIEKIFVALDSLTGEQMIVLDAYQLYYNSLGLNVSGFRILALFAAIEFLITHEAGDSLTRQIKGKLPLLCRRFDAPYPPEQFFPKAGIKAWEILYDYRSAIAHGNKIGFELRNKNGGFEELKSMQDVFFFLNEFVRRLLRHAIIEPQLCLDLKKC